MTAGDIQRIKYDHRSGAERLAESGMGTLEEFVRNYDGSMNDELVSALRDTGSKIAAAQPFMASIANRVDAAVKYAENKLGACMDAGELRRSMLRWFEWEQGSKKEMLQMLVHHGKTCIPGGAAVMTCSASGTVEEVLKSASGSVDFSVILSESRPVCEGTDFARRIAQWGVSVTLVVDAMLPLMVEKADVVITGADWIGETQFTNKIGTSLIVEKALQRSVPVYVAASTDKIRPEKHYPAAPESHPSEEVADIEQENITVVNRYFERIPLDDSMRFITEEGILTARQVAGRTNSSDPL